MLSMFTDVSLATHADIHPGMGPYCRFEESLMHAAPLIMRQFSEFTNSVMSFTLR